MRALTRPGEAVLVQSPVYDPFYNVVRENGRTLVENRLIYRNHQYTMDFAGLEREIVRHKVKLMLLCSPHNPVGRVWTRAELQEVGRICKAHGVFVVSDEITCDFRQTPQKRRGRGVSETGPLPPSLALPATIWG